MKTFSEAYLDNSGAMMYALGWMLAKYDAHQPLSLTILEGIVLGAIMACLLAATRGFHRRLDARLSGHFPGAREP